MLVYFWVSLELKWTNLKARRSMAKEVKWRIRECKEGFKAFYEIFLKKQIKNIHTLKTALWTKPNTQGLISKIITKKYQIIESIYKLILSWFVNCCTLYTW